MFACIAQELNERDVFEPVVVIGQFSRNGYGGVKIKEKLYLIFYAIQFFLHLLIN